jgi:hypothetical protein
MSVSLEGLMTVGGDETRALAIVKVDHNGQTYDWQIFVPPNTDLSTFITGSEARLKAEIDAKEAEWTALTPKTREIEDPMTGETTTVEIDKSEIVRPEIPDYYAKRRAEYPSAGDQLGAQWKGGVEAADMFDRIQAVKDKYPKPPWITN